MPDIDPPAELEATTLAAMARATEVRQMDDSPRYIARAAVWLVAIGAGAWLSVWLLNDQTPGIANPAANSAETAAIALSPNAGARAGSATSAVSGDSVRPMDPSDEFYALLVEESMRLEQLLALMPEPRRVMRADTASTIVSLEDRVALIDAALRGAGDQANVPEYRTALMLDRVEVMNALVNVRYAQSRAFVF